MERYIVGDFIIDGYDNYQAALEDIKRIQIINSKVDMHNPVEALRLNKYIKAGKIRFRSEIGKKFVASLDEYVEAHCEKEAEAMDEQVIVEAEVEEPEYKDYEEPEVKRSSFGAKLAAFVCAAAILLVVGLFTGTWLSGMGDDSDGKVLGAVFTAEKPVLSQYTELLAINPDLIGCIKIPGTSIDYPIVNAAGKEAHYVTHDFYGNEADIGCVLVKSDIAAQGNNIIIYGNNSNNLVQFGAMDEYLDESYYKDHSMITLDTLYEGQQYKIIGVCLVDPLIGENGFNLEAYSNISDTGTFKEFMSKIGAFSIYPTGESADYEDDLITLATYTNSIGDGKLFIVAKKV